MTRKGTIAVVLSLLFLESAAWGEAKMPPARIGGVLMIAKTISSINNTECMIDITQVMKENDSGYTFAVTRRDETHLISTAGGETEDTDGLNEYHCYIIDIPIYNGKSQPDGAKPGDKAMIHVYKDGFELPVIFPLGGLFVVGNIGSLKDIDIMAEMDGYPSPPMYFEEPCDINCDGKSGLEDAIRILQTLSESP